MGPSSPDESCCLHSNVVEISVERPVNKMITRSGCLSRAIEPIGLFFFVPAKEKYSDGSVLEDEGCDF